MTGSNKREMNLKVAFSLLIFSILDVVSTQDMDCVPNLKNIAVYEGHQNIIMNYTADPNNVRWTIYPTSDEFGNYTISGSGGFRNPSLTGLFYLNQSGLVVLSATIVPDRDPIATAGLYIAQCSNDGNRIGAKLLVVRSSPICSCNASSPDAVQLSCSLLYADGTVHPVFANMAWTVGDVVYARDVPRMNRIDYYVFQSTSTIMVDSSVPENYTCTVAFNSPTDISYDFIAMNAPEFSASCSVEVCSFVTTSSETTTTPINVTQPPTTITLPTSATIKSLVTTTFSPLTTTLLPLTTSLPRLAKTTQLPVTTAQPSLTTTPSTLRTMQSQLTTTLSPLTTTQLPLTTKQKLSTTATRLPTTLTDILTTTTVVNRTVLSTITSEPCTGSACDLSTTNSTTTTTTTTTITPTTTRPTRPTLPSTPTITTLPPTLTTQPSSNTTTTTQLPIRTTRPIRVTPTVTTSKPPTSTTESITNIQPSTTTSAFDLPTIPTKRYTKAMSAPPAVSTTKITTPSTIESSTSKRYTKLLSIPTLLQTPSATRCNCTQNNPCPPPDASCKRSSECQPDGTSLTAMYAEAVVNSSLYAREDKCCPMYLVFGVVVTLRDGSRFLIHDPLLVDGKCHVIAVNASCMSSVWYFIKDKTVTRSVFGDFVQTGNSIPIDSNGNDCENNSDKMMTLS